MPNRNYSPRIKLRHANAKRPVKRSPKLKPATVRYLAGTQLTILGRLQTVGGWINATSTRMRPRRLGIRVPYTPIVGVPPGAHILTHADAQKLLSDIRGNKRSRP